ncbi:glycosyl transferase family protein [Calothrix sp. NIES-4101]|nr:glycosyl transferase family protein [Calothrix sp. NIES-4101]
MSNNTPKITVLMPVYNGECYLQETIDSILSQTLCDFEFLIINDGSTDYTKEIICSYNDPRIRLIDNESNLGLTKCLNKGLQLAKGELIARQDADDISYPERFAQQVDFLETHPEVALLGTWYNIIDAQGNIVGQGEKPCKCTQIRWELSFCCSFIHSSVMFRKSTILEQVGFYDETFIYAQDYDLWCRIACKLKVANLNEYLLKLRLNPSSMTATYGSIVENEPLKIRINNIENLLGWTQTNILSDKVQLKTISALWIGYFEHLNLLSLQDVNKIIEKILILNCTFCDYYKLTKIERITHDNQLYNRLSKQILELANYYLHENKNIAWQFLIKSYLLNKHIIFQQRYIRIALQVILGSDAVKFIRRIQNQ